jgi:hypothetical protein
VSDVNANIGIHFDTSDALAQLRRLQAGLSKFNQALTEGNVAAANAQKGLNSQLIQSINATGKFVASQKTIASSTTAFTDALEKNKLSMGQYFRYTAAAATMNSKTLKGLFAQEKDVLKRAMKDRVKTLQTQYVQLTNANGELVKVLQVVPKHLKMVNGQYADYATRTQMAAQRQQFLNQLLKQGSTQLLNFGKNTQWAGRQLMVGLTIPLSILGSTAAKVFREMEEATIKFTRVYGDMTTSMGDTDKAVVQIQRLAKEFTKFGIAAKDTMEMAASAAAMGLQGADLQAQVTEATRLAVLGQVEQQQALETTISLQNAFGISAEQLAQKINFLNAVENQTVLSIEDLTIAIPKAGPVVKQLGGSVEDLAFFMTAMKEGGINASEGANALKSGLASMINPAKKTSEFLAGLGINIKGIVDSNAGNLKGTVVGLARALDTLDPLNRARAIEQLFGKFQFARLSTLFQNVTKDSSQAARALGLAGASVEELAILSERELGKVENAVGVKFQKQLENLKLQLIPIGKAFLEAVTPIVQFAGKILEKFNNLSDGTKKFVVGFIGLIGGIAPIVLMTVGLVANGVANLIKFFAMLRGGVAKLNGQNNVLGGSFDYLTQAETENLAQTHALHLSHKDLISTFNVEKTSVEALAAAYQNASSQARALASGSPALFNAVPGPKGAVSGLPKFANGKVPGNESEGDSILALVAPGETIVPTALSKKYAPLLKGIMGDDLPGFKKGRYADSVSQADRTYSASQAAGDSTAQDYIENELGRIRQLSKNALIKYAEATGKDVSDTSSKALEEIRDSIISDFKTIIAEVKAETGKVTEETIASIGKKFDPAKGSSRMGAYHPKFDQLQRQEFSHVGQTKRVDASEDDGLRLSPEARNQVELIKKFYGDGGGSGNGQMPELKVADAHGFMLQGKLNNAMSTRGKSQSYEAKNGAGSLGVDFQADFEKTGAEKWRAMTTMMGGDFDELKGQAEIYDNLLIDKLKKWNADNAAKEVPEIFDDATFKLLESQVTTEMQKLAPEFAGIVEQAKRSITAIRISLGEDFEEVNAMLKANGAGSLGTNANNSKILNHEARPEDPTLLGTMEPHSIADQVDADLTAAEQKAETQSPSKRTKRLGKDIADGLALGLAEGKDGVKAQSSQLTDAALPTAADTQAKVDKMDLGNKAFYDDLDTPELRDQRQILKSQDRQRRKLGSNVTVDSVSETAGESQASILIASRARTEAAAEQLAVKTEEAATAQSQVVQQIRDESKTRVKIKGNTINIGQAREEADKAESEAATARKNAAALEKEQAKQVKSKSPTTITDEQVLEAKEKANALELEAAKKRQTVAMAELDGKDIVVSDEDVKDIGKVQKIKDENQELISNGTQEQGDGLRRIVDGTEDTADSTLLVAEQTDEIATVTGDIIPAQTENLDSVVTTATLNDAIVGTTGDIHGSTIDTAMSQEDINRLQEEEKFLREQMNSNLAQQNAALAGSDLSQTGKKRYTKDQALAEAYGDGTDSNPGYTMDKNGQLLFDPELDADGKKQPTTMTEKQIKKKKRGMRREKVGKVSGKATGALGAATMVAGMAGAPPQVTAALGAATTVAQFAPMLAGMGPVGWAAAGIMAVGAGAYMLNQHFNKMAAESAKFVLATSATRDSMKKMGELTGTVGASQIMDRRRQGSQYTKYNESYKVPNKFGNKFMSSELGKDTKKTFKENTKKFGNEKAADDLGLKLAAQIADGVLSQEQAESISQALALSLKDQKVQMQVTGRIRTLLGPNGENLEKEPLETRLNLIANARARSTKTLGNIEKDGKAGKSQRKDIAALAALNMNNLEMSTMMADQLEIHYETQKKKLEAELASTTNAQKRLELEEQIKKVTADATLATETMNANLGTQIAMGQRDFNKFYSGSVLGGQATREDAFFDGQSAAVKSAYAGTGQEKSADKFLKETKQFETGATSATTKVNGQYVTNGLQSGKAAQQFQAKLQMLVGSKVLSPDEAMSYTKMFAGKLGQLNQLLTLSLTERGSAKTKELFNMFAGFKSKATATKLVKYMVQLEKGPKFDQNMETLKNLQALDGLTIDMELVLKGGPAVLEEIERRQNLLEKLKEETEAEEKKTGKKQSGDDFVKAAIKATPEDTAAFEALLANGEKMEQFRKLSKDQQTEYLQKLAIGYTYEKGLNEEQIKADAELFIEKQMITNADYRLLQDGTQAYKDARAKLLADYMSQTAGDRAETNLDIGVVTGISSNIPPGGTGAGDKKERDTTYDDIMKRLRNVRLSALNAAGGFKELEKAIAKTGSKAIGDRFKGLEQQMIKLGKSAQFTDYLAGLDQKELNKFGKTATKDGIDPNTGKKKKGVKAGDFTLSDKGIKMEKGFNKAIIGDYNKAQLLSVTYAKQEIAARGKLLALGYDELDIQTMLADENYKTLIATGKVTDAELKTNAALTKQARIRNQINGAVAGQKDLQKTTDNQKRIPEVVKMMQDGGMSAEAIRAAITDPAMLDTLINGMDNFANLAKDAQDEFNHLLSQIEDIPERKIVEIAFTQTREEKIINAATAATEMLDAYKMIDENTLKNKEGNTFAGLQVQMEDLGNQSKIAQNAINLTQSKIDDMQKAVDADQRNIETNFTRPIEKKQREIEKLTRSAELNFTRPIQALQERSAVLSHDLDVMNKAAEAINEKYDKQQEALTAVAEINQRIIGQQQQQLGLADALSQGDISAAAKAVQDIRSTNAANYATDSQSALQKARENEVGGLRGGVSGKTQKEIQDEQYSIGEQVYQLELKKAAVDKEILAIQDSIYTLEQSRQVALDAIQVKTDAIAKITFGTLLDEQNALKAIQDKILPLQSQSDLLAAQITANDRNRVLQGQTRAEWDLTLKAAQAAEKLAKGDLALALAGINTVSGTVKGAWDSIKSSYDAIKDKSITITQHIVTTYGAALGLPDPNAGKTDPNAGKTDPAKSPGAAWISDGKGGWKKPDKPAGDYGWDDTKGWVKGYYGSTPPPNPSNGYGTNDSAAEANMRAKALEETKRLAAAAAKAEEERLAALEKQRLQAAAKAEGMARRYGGYALSSGGLVPKYFAAGGYARGTDTVPAMLTPGEFVMSRYAVNTHGTDRMKAINSGASVGDSVYNYNLSVNVKSDANPNEIAKTVIAQIKQIDSQRMRGTRI